MNVRADVAIVGGGLVGATTACLLADAGFEIAVIDPVPQLPVRDEPYDLRTYSLTPASRRILAAAGVWSGLDQQRICAYHAMQVWEARGRGAIGFAAGTQDPPVLGYIVEQANLLAGLQSAVGQRSRIAVWSNRLTELVPAPAANVLSLSNGARIEARLVLACDGADSPLRKLIGIECEEHDYGQHAIVANVTTTRQHDTIARQCFLPAGPLAFLPLPAPHSSSIVWSTSPATAEWALGADDGAFCAALAAAFEHRLGDVAATSRRIAFPLRRMHARRYCAGRVALLGDAAHVVHPLAGQGLNLGLLDAAALAELLGASRSAVLDHPGSQLRRYERWRRGENLAMLLVTDGLNRLFTARHPTVKWARNTGLRLTDRLGPVKQLLMAQAMGDGGDLPRIARP